MRTWWGEKFLDVLATCMDQGRLQRGRAYSGPRRLLKFNIDGQTVEAVMRGNKNPYFGVYTEPRYKVSVRLKQFSAKDWNRITEAVSLNTAVLCHLLMNEMPPTIESIFFENNLHLLPRKRSDLVVSCSCPDYANPCKHIAGVYYKIASLLDRDPLLVFQLRGMTFDRLQKKLISSPLGQALIDHRKEDTQEIEYRSHRYTAPQIEPLETVSLRSFWQGLSSPPRVDAMVRSAVTPAVLIRKGGDYPSFWTKYKSFIETMEPIYTRVVDKNKNSL
ncbi:MAG: SWIM zinc finger family protein [Bacteroidota bacterium]|nr:SWIM zinc finger family protein [Bacteroidota bacterium]MDE2833067.1 SWIM zinc finger family protein [Bacteroidota bacterium]